MNLFGQVDRIGEGKNQLNQPNKRKRVTSMSKRSKNQYRKERYIAKKVKSGMTREEAESKWQKAKAIKKQARINWLKNRQKEKEQDERDGDIVWLWKVLNQNERLVTYFQEAFDENVYLDLVDEWVGSSYPSYPDDEVVEGESIVNYYIDHYVPKDEQDEKRKLWDRYTWMSFEWC